MPLPPPPAAALTISRVADLVRECEELLDVGERLRGPGTIGTPAAFIAVRAAVFEPISSIALRWRADPREPAASTARANPAFRQEAVAGMDRAGAGRRAVSTSRSTTR